MKTKLPHATGLIALALMANFGAHANATTKDNHQAAMADALKSWQASVSSSQRQDLLAERPSLVFLYAGSPYAKEYNSPRGHQFAIKDVSNVLRTGAGSKALGDPGASCWSCKAPGAVKLSKEHGVTGFAAMSFADAASEMKVSVGCIDCHEPGSDKLALPRPHAQNAMNKIQMPFAKQTDADQSSQVCGQCHVTYYFQPEKANAVNIPWIFGSDADSIEKYYDTRQFYDFVHPVSGVPLAKARHPEFEHWSRSVHAKSNIGCVDCHMADKTGEDGQVYTDHKITSGFNNFESKCVACHESPAEIEDRVAQNKAILDKKREQIEALLVKAHVEAGAAWELGLKWHQLQSPLMDIRHAQWRWDYVVSSHGAHAHNSEEAFALLDVAFRQVNMARAKLEIILKEHNAPAVTYPELNTKAQAQALVGLNMEELIREKHQFLTDVVEKNWPTVSYSVTEQALTTADFEALKGASKSF